MSPHQRLSIAAVLTVKSRPIRSGRAAAFGSGVVVTRQRRGLLPLAGHPHPAGDAFTAVPQTGVSEFGVDPRRPVGALRRCVHLENLGGELLVKRAWELLEVSLSAYHTHNTTSIRKLV
jgi:hypothetical protein